MKLFKLLVKSLAVLLVLAVIAAVVLVVTSRQKPDWYAQAAQLDPEVMAEAARRAEDKLSATVSWAAGREAAEARVRTGTPDEPPPPDLPPRDVTSPAAPDADELPEVVPPAQRPVLNVTFTEQELNAIFQKWSKEQNWEQAYGQYLADPAVVIRDGRIVLAGTVIELNLVASLHFEPDLSPEGDLHLNLERVMAGRLAMPQALFQNYRLRLKQAVREQLPAEQRAARLAADGSVNNATMKAAMGKLLLNVLNEEPAEPVLFVTGNRGRTVPVKMTQANVDGDSITIGVEMMDAAERQAFFDRIRHPHGTAAARGE